MTAFRDGAIGISALTALYRKANADVKRAVLAQLIPDGGYQRVDPAASHAEQTSVEWTKYPPPRDPFAERDGQ